MRINKIHIRNLKSFDEVSFSFDKRIALIYGQNGMGKTTILEAVSLIGHLPAMRRVEARDSRNIIVSDSHLLSALKAGMFNVVATQSPFTYEFTEIENTYKAGNDFIQLKIDIETKYAGMEGDLDDWFKRKIPLENQAIIRYELLLNEKNDEDVIVFYVWLEGKEDLSITKTLGRNAFDDIKMNYCYALVWEARYSRVVAMFGINKLT